MKRRRPLLETLIEALDYPTAEELADTLWLARYLPAKDTQARDTPMKSHDPGEYPPVSAAHNVPSEPPQDPTAFIRALRPLRRTAQSRIRTEIDERATAEKIAEDTAGTWLPNLRPAAERWLDITIVTDSSTSMTIWQTWVRDVTQLLRQAGVFRRIWQCHIDTDQPLRGLGTVDNLGHRAGERSQPVRRGRHIILILSDCMGWAWRNENDVPPPGGLGSARRGSYHCRSAALRAYVDEMRSRVRQGQGQGQGQLPTWILY